MNLSLGAPRIYGWPDALLRSRVVIRRVRNFLEGHIFIHGQAN